MPSAQFGTMDHIQSLHKFPYIYPIFLLLMSYSTLYFYLKLPINYPIFCSEYACRPAGYQISGAVFKSYRYRVNEALIPKRASYSSNQVTQWNLLQNQPRGKPFPFQIFPKPRFLLITELSSCFPKLDILVK